MSKLVAFLGERFLGCSIDKDQRVERESRQQSLGELTSVGIGFDQWHQTIRVWSRPLELNGEYSVGGGEGGAALLVDFEVRPA